MRTKRIRNRRINLLTGVVACMYSFLSAYGQLDQLTTFMATGKQDAMKLTEAYVSPYVNAVGSNLSGGWYNSARPHKFGGFNLTLSWNFAFVPAMDKEFDLDALGLSANADYAETDHMAPTAAGEAGEGPEITYANAVSFNTPGGTGLPFMSTPMITGAVGFPKGIELMGRYLPPVELGKNGKIDLWGVGLKHDLLQYMGVVDRLPALNFSVMAGYTQVHSSVLLSDKTGTVGDYELKNPSLDFTIASFTGNLLVGVTLPVIAVYGGAGFATSNADLVMNGFYINEQEDPLRLEIKNSSGGLLNPRLNAGFRLRMSLVAFHVDYTYADYSVLTTGVGLSFR